MPTFRRRLGKKLLAVVGLQWDDGVEHMKSHPVQAFFDAPFLHVALSFLKVRHVFQDIREMIWNKGLLICEAIGLHGNLVLQHLVQHGM